MSEGMLKLRRAVGSVSFIEKIKIIYLVDPSYAFTEADAKAAEEANLPWSRIEREKREAEAREKA
jgi:hypothetical protein